MDFYLSSPGRPLRHTTTPTPLSTPEGGRSEEEGEVREAGGGVSTHYGGGRRAEDEKIRQVGRGGEDEEANMNTGVGVVREEDAPGCNPLAVEDAGRHDH